MGLECKVGKNLISGFTFILRLGKVIIDKLRGELSLVEQDTFDYAVSVAYLKFIIKFPRKNLHFFHLHCMQLFSATIFKKN